MIPSPLDRPALPIHIMLVGIAVLLALAIGYIAAQAMAATPLNEAKNQLAASQAQAATLRSQVSDLQSEVTYLRGEVKQAHLEIGGPADAFSGNIHDLLQEHTFTLINTLRRSLSASEAFNDSYAALLLNIDEMGGQVESIYGKDNATTFKNLWHTKIDNFITYTNAIRTGDPIAASSELNAKMAVYEESSASFWATLNPRINKAAIKQIVTNHVNDIKVALDYWQAKNYPAYFDSVHTAYNQAGTFADALVAGIVKQHPEKFA